MTNAPDRIWAHCFNTEEFGAWDKWGGYARVHNRHPLDDNERATGAEYVRADLFDTLLAENSRLRDALVNIRTEEHMLDAAQVNYPEMKVHRRISLADKMIETARDALQYNPFNNED